jgi:hypothetical protein
MEPLLQDGFDMSLPPDHVVMQSLARYASYFMPTASQTRHA